MSRRVRQVDLSLLNHGEYKNNYVGCLVLTKDNKILLQQRGQDWDRFPGYLATFGGHIEQGETPMQALIRELNEELGAIVDPHDVIHLGPITEEVSAHSEIVYTYFWHDKNGTITGCYEGEPSYYQNKNAVLEHAKIMDDVIWMLQLCKQNKYIT